MRETPKAAAAFHEYCLLGPGRSLAKLAKYSEKFGMPSVSIRHLEQWSSAHEWVARSMLYDKERAEEARIEREEAIRLMNQRHALIGTTQQAKAVKQIETLIEAKSFGSMAAVQLLKLATDLERLARGESTQQMVITGKDGGPVQTQVVEIYKIRIPDNERNIDEGIHGN